MEQNNSTDKKASLSWSSPAAAAKPAAPAQKALPTAPQASFIGRYVGIFAAGIVVGFLFSWGYSSMSGPGAPVASNTSSSTTGKTNTSAAAGASSIAAGVVIDTTSNAALEVASPQRAGLSVAINKVTVAKPTWVVVYESRDGAPGNVLGAHLFFESRAGTVTLLRSTVAGAEYFVGTSVDNGDRKYSKAADKPATAEDGSLEVVSFTAN